jgi:hypothetical protein
MFTLTSRSKTFVVLTGALGLTLVVVFLRHTQERQYFIQEAQRPYLYMNKILAPANKDLVILGDSRALIGLDPAMFTKTRTKEKVLNLAFLNQTIHSDYVDFAVSKLNRDGRKKLLIALTPYNFFNYKNTSSGHAKWAELSYIKKIELKYFSYWLAYLKPFNTLGKNLEITQNIDRTFHENGFVEVSDASDVPSKSVDELLPFYQSFKSNSGAYSNLESLLRRLRSKNIDVYVLNMITGNSHQQAYSLSNIWEPAKIRSIVNDSGAVWVMPKQKLKLEFYDDDHLLGSSAKKYSEAVAKELFSNEEQYELK